MAEKSSKDDLDELLDSALKDFDKPSCLDKCSKNDGASETGTKNNDDGVPDTVAFFEEHAKLLAERMQNIFGDTEAPAVDLPPLPPIPDKILAGYKKVAEAACMTLEGTNPACDEEVAQYSDSIAQALKDLQAGADNLTATPESNDVLGMLGNLNLEGSLDSDGNMFMALMEGMMQSLFSGEILLPSIKTLVELYPKYLEESKDTLSAEDKERYEKQLELYKLVEAKLESEKPDDSPAVKRERSREVLQYMRKLPDLGPVPAPFLNGQGDDVKSFESFVGGVQGNTGGGPQCPTM